MKLEKLIRQFVNKETVPQQTGRGRRGYGNVVRVRALVYQHTKKIHRDKRLIRHLEKKEQAVKILGMEKIPHRTTVGRWKKKNELMKVVLENVGKMVALIFGITLAVVDSTPLEDWDKEAKTGYTSKGSFRGFKTHFSVNHLGLPLKAIFTTGNKHDSPFFPELINVDTKITKGTPVLGDAGYDSKVNRKAAREKGFRAYIAKNKRNTKTKKRKYTWKILKKKRYIVEQTNSFLKEILDDAWKNFKGMKKKASIVFAALIGMNVVAIGSVVTGKFSKEVCKYWC